MGYVLADQRGWLSSTQSPFKIVPLGDFASLRAAVSDGRADAFMWEWFTSKRYFSPEYASATPQSFDAKPSPSGVSSPGSGGANHPIRPLGIIPTPWPSWMIACVPGLANAGEDGVIDPRMEALFAGLDRGIKHFEEHEDESVKYISTNLDYSTVDAQDWMKTVKFVHNTRGVKREVLENVISLLMKAGVLEEANVQEEVKRMSGILR